MALFALVLQFAVAFGHIHVDTDRSAAARGTVVNLDIDKRGSPAPSDHGNAADEACAICATVKMTSAAQVAASPALPLPVAYPVAELSLSSEKVLDDLRCLELRSRGPPQT